MYRNKEKKTKKKVHTLLYSLFAFFCVPIFSNDFAWRQKKEYKKEKLCRKRVVTVKNTKKKET